MRRAREANPAVDAIDRVLEVEAQAREAVRAAEDAARARVEDARDQARRIRRRTTQRIVELHRRQIEKTEAFVAELKREAERTAPTTDLDADDRVALERAAEALARELTEVRG